MKGDLNYADCYSKHHVVAHHKQVHPKCLVAKATTRYRKEKYFTTKKTSNNLTLHSQKPISVTRAVLLRHGLCVGRRLSHLVIEVLIRAPNQTSSYAACSTTSGEYVIGSYTRCLLVLQFLNLRVPSSECR